MSEDWLALTEDRNVDMLPAATLDALVDMGADLAFVMTDLATARNFLERVPPEKLAALAILIPPASGAHPFVALLAAMARAKREWEGTFDALAEAVAVVEPSGAIRRVNRAFANLVSRPFGEILGRHYTELLGDVSDGVNDPIADVLLAARAEIREVRLSRIPGTFQVTTSPLFAPEGQTSGAAVTIKEVTALVEQRARLEQVYRLADIGRLAGGVAHEISTPLTSIALRAESLLRKLGNPTVMAEPAFVDFPRYLKTIEEQTFRCKKIIGALLEFSRRPQPVLAPTPLNALIEQGVALIGDQAREKQVSLSVRLDPAVPLVSVDAGQIRETLLALLLNALDATGAGGAISIETAVSADGRVSFSVADNGTGIPPENLGKIFTLFFTTKPIGEGTGLGLTICEGIVRAHGGEIRAESVPGSGSRFTVTFPGSAGRSAPDVNRDGQDASS